VFLRLQPYKKNSLKAEHCQKLARSIWLQPEAVLDQRERRLRQRTIKEVLVQWKDMTPADATWEPATILQQFPHLKP
jgi:hypothetical protein